MMPIEMVKRVRNSDLAGADFGRTPDVKRNNKAKLLALEDGGLNTTMIKPKPRKLIDVTEVSDFQPIAFGNDKPWEAIHNGILKQDMAGQRIKMQNGY